MEQAQMNYHDGDNYLTFDIAMVIKIAKKSFGLICFGFVLLLLMALLPVPHKQPEPTIIPKEVKAIIQTVESTLQRTSFKLDAHSKID